MRRILLYISCICLALLSFLQVRAERIDTLLHFNLSDLQIDTVTAPDGQLYTKLFYPGCGEGERIGTPSLPVKYIRFVLPYNTGDVSVHTNTTRNTPRFVDWEIYPVQPAIPYSLSLPEITSISRDSIVYSMNEPYPSERGHIKKDITRKNGERYVVVAVYPVVYNPVGKEYTFCEDITLSLSYSKNGQSTNTTKSQRAATPLSGLPYYEYCVITCDSLKDSFKRLIAWQRQKGIDAGIVCVEDILSNTTLGQTQDEIINSVIDPGPYDNQDAGKVRQYLREAVINEGITEYVLLGGDYNIIPTRYAKRNDLSLVSGASSEDMLIPSDWYYSELSSSWFRSAYSNPFTGDLSSEANVAVGRILCTTPQDVENYTNKLLRYEMNPGNGNTYYLKSALYLQADQGQQMNDAKRIETIDSLNNTYTTRWHLEERPGYDSGNPTFPSGNSTIYRLKNTRCGYASFYAHGNPYIIKTMTRGVNNGGEYMHNERTNAVTSIQGIKSLSSAVDIVSETNNGFDKMDNKLFPMFMYSCSCTSMPFDEQNVYNFFVDVPNIGKSLTTGGDYGCAAFVGNTRLGIVKWSSIMQGRFNGEIQDRPIGNALNRVKDWYNNVDSCRLKQYIMLSTNLIGSPNMWIWSARPSTYNVTYEDNNITFNEFTTDANVINHNISLEGDWESSHYDNVIGEMSGPTFGSTFTMIYGRNYLPKILPLYIWCEELHGTHYLFTKDVTCEYNYAPVIFETDADYTFEKNGTFRIGKGVKIERGAHVKIISSEINF